MIAAVPRPARGAFSAVGVHYVDETTRRRLLVTSDGVLVFGERLRAVGWARVSARLVSAGEIDLAAPDIQVAWARGLGRVA